MTPRIVTLTLNPAVDTAFEANNIEPYHKTRTYGETHDPGGGGVNVARVLREFDADTCAVVLAGGVTGAFLVELLHGYDIPCRAIPIAGKTRISTTVHDRSTGLEYRFVPERPVVTEAELAAALAALDHEPGDWIVRSGSLPRGLPADTYARIADRESPRGRHVVLDTNGDALAAALGHGLALIKPSERELAQLAGDRPPAEAAADLVGAGDSFLAAMTLALATGTDAEDALFWGLAAGAAAVSQNGTAHPSRADVAALYHSVRENA